MHMHVRKGPVRTMVGRNASGVDLLAITNGSFETVVHRAPECVGPSESVLETAMRRQIRAMAEFRNCWFGVNETTCVVSVAAESTDRGQRLESRVKRSWSGR